MAQSNCGRGGRMAPPGSNKRMGMEAGFVPRICHHDTRGSPSNSLAQKTGTIANSPIRHRGGAYKDKPFGWPRKARPSLTATRHDGAVELRSGRKNGSAGVKQKNGCESSFRAKILSSRYARAAINFPGTKNRNTRGFSHQTPWSCLHALRRTLPTRREVWH